MNVSSPFSSLTAAVLPSPAAPERRPYIEGLFTDYEHQVVQRTNQFFTWLLPLQWGFAVFIASVWSPQTWSGTQSAVHPHLLAAVFLGALLTIPPMWLIRRQPYDLPTRHVVAIAQMAWSALLIDVTGGRIETHFHVFGSLAFLALYRDWRVLPTATLVVALDHLVGGLWFPEAVYGVPFATVWRTAEHSGWVAFEDAVLIWACLVSRREMWEICLRQDENHQLLGELEQRVRERTGALQAEVHEHRRTAQELDSLHQQLIVASREAGMAEVATGVLHNVGNVLTSVNLIIHDVQDRLGATRLSHLRVLTRHLQGQQHRLVEFLTEDSIGRSLPDFLVKLDQHLAAENRTLVADVDTLRNHCEHIRDIIVAQQQSANLCGFTENLAPAKLIEDALRISSGSLERHGIVLERAFSAAPPVRADRHKVLQILVNLLKNAKDSVTGAQPAAPRIVAKVTLLDPTKVALSVSDNGSGIAAENRLKVFQHGFTTKKDGHGFGLHSCVLAAREMSGDLTVTSDGPGRGAIFTLILPVAEPEAR